MWIMIPQVLLHDKELTSTARYIFGLIVGMTGSQGACYLSDFEISEAVNASERAVRDNIEVLEKKQLIKRIDRGTRSFVPDFTVIHDFSPQNSQNKFGTNLAFSTYDTSSTTNKSTSTDVQKETLFFSSKKQIKENSSDSDVVRRVFDYWNTRRIETLSERNVRAISSRLTSKRRSVIKSRLSAGRTEEEMRKAIDGCLSSDYHVENGYIDLTLICRDDEKLDRFIIRYEHEQNREELGPKLRVLND